MNEPATVTIVASFEIEADELAATLRHLNLRAAMAQTGFDKLNPSDRLALRVLIASGHINQETNP